MLISSGAKSSKHLKLVRFCENWNNSYSSKSLCESISSDLKMSSCFIWNNSDEGVINTFLIFFNDLWVMKSNNFNSITSSPLKIILTGYSLLRG